MTSPRSSPARSAGMPRSMSVSTTPVSAFSMATPSRHELGCAFHDGTYAVCGESVATLVQSLAKSRLRIVACCPFAAGANMLAAITTKASEKIGDNVHRIAGAIVVLLKDSH
jgi:hypothetical protein